MYLNKLTLINWGTLPPQTYEFTPTTLITGESGAGKSMLLDAIQTVLTAAHRNLTRYNIAQSETDKRSRNKKYRTLEGYVLGQMSESFQREVSQAWVAAAFGPSEGELCSPFTAIVGASAYLEAKEAQLDQIAFYIVHDEVTREHLLNKNKTVVVLKEAKSHLLSRFGERKVLPFDSKKTEYLQSLYGAFEGLGNISEPEAFASARAISRACAFRPVESVHETIRSELLDEVDVSEIIESISGTMRQLQALKREAAQIESALHGLTEVESRLVIASRNLATARATDLAEARAQVALAENNEAVNRAAQEAEVRKQETLARLIQAETVQLGSVTTRQIQVEAQWSADPVGAEVRRLKGEIKHCEEGLSEKSLYLLTASQAIHDQSVRWQAAREALSRVPALGETFNKLDATLHGYLTDGVPVLLTQLRQGLKSESDLVLARAGVERAQTRLEAHHHALAVGEDSFLAQVAGCLVDARNEGNALDTHIEETSSRVATLSAGRTYLPPHIRRVVTAIQEDLPGSNPTVLAEHVEPKPGSEWQSAIEGFLRDTRYAILVEPQFESSAYAIVQRMGGDVRVVQSGKVQRQSRETRPLPGSILEELVVRSTLAKAYLVATFGNVLKVFSRDDLREVNRGITLFGMMASGNTVHPYRMAREEDCVFGAAGGGRSLAAAERSLAALREQKRVCCEREALLKGVNAWPRQPVDLAQPFEALVVLQAALISHRENLSHLNTSQLVVLEGEREELEREAARLNMAISEYNRQIGSAQTEAGLAADRVTDAQEARERYERLRGEALARLEQLCAMDDRVTLTSLQEEATAIGTELDWSVSRLSGRTTLQLRGLHVAVLEVNRMVGAYNEGVVPANQVPGTLALFDNSVESQMQVAVQLSALSGQVHQRLLHFRSHLLAENAAALQEAQARFHAAFTTTFAQRMCDLIDSGVRPLNELNSRIRGMVFGRDSYKVLHDFIPEYKTYWEFFKAVKAHSHELCEGRTLFDVELPADLARVRDELKDLLLERESREAEARLAEITDWRNYRKYDVEVFHTDVNSHSLLSEWGTGSGGENQTPFYVIRAAILASALRHYNHSKSHLKLLVLDEAFAAMDTKRSTMAMTLQRERFGFQVIVVMPTKNSGPVKPLFTREYQLAMVDQKQTSKRMTICRQVELKSESIQEIFASSFAAIAATETARFETQQAEAEAAARVVPTPSLLEDSPQPGGTGMPNGAGPA